MFEKTRMPFQTDVFAARAPYSFEGAVRNFIYSLLKTRSQTVLGIRHLFLPHVCWRGEIFFFAFVNLFT